MTLYATLTLVIAVIIPTTRRWINTLARFLWMQFSHLMSAVMVMFAVSASALSSIGMAPISFAGTVMMTPVLVLGGALILRWMETH